MLAVVERVIPVCDQALKVARVTYCWGSEKPMWYRWASTFLSEDGNKNFARAGIIRIK